MSSQSGPSNPPAPGPAAQAPAPVGQQFVQGAQPAPIDYFNIPLSLKDVKQFHDVIVNNQSRFQAHNFVQDIQYRGFERSSFIIAAALKITASQMIRLAIIGAIRGANFKKIVGSSEKVDADLVKLVDDKVVLRTAVGSSDITILRCTAAIPQWCAYFLGTAAVQKKMPSMECPAALQFPAAGSLPMSREVRLQHIKFCIYFSKMIKGVFKESIYMAMMSNTVDPREIPDEVKMILGANEPNLDVTKYIDDIKKEATGSEIVKV
jgi:hypothetical protein